MPGKITIKNHTFINIKIWVMYYVKNSDRNVDEMDDEMDDEMMVDSETRRQVDVVTKLLFAGVVIGLGMIVVGVVLLLN